MLKGGNSATAKLDDPFANMMSWMIKNKQRKASRQVDARRDSLCLRYVRIVNSTFSKRFLMTAITGGDATAAAEAVKSFVREDEPTNDDNNGASNSARYPKWRRKQQQPRYQLWPFLLQ